MKKDYSLIDIRLIELRSHYLLKIFITGLIILLSFVLVYVVFSLPVFFDVFYQEAFLETFSIIYQINQKSQKIINIFLVAIAILVVVLVNIIQYYYYNKKYHKYYSSFFFDELKLIDYVPNNHKFSLSMKTLDTIFIANGLNVEIYEEIANIVNDHYFDIYQLTIKEQKVKQASLYVLTFKKHLKEFIQIDTTNNHKVNQILEKNVFDFYLDSPKYVRRINVFSSFGNKTNSICSNELIDMVNKIQLYFSAPVSITIFDNFLALYVPNQKIKISQPLHKKYKANLIEKKVNTVDNIYHSLKAMFEHIYSKGG